MSTFDEVYNNIITDLALGGPRRNVLWPSTDSNIIFEDVYFHTLPSGFTKYFYDIIKEMYDSKTIEREFDFRNALSKISENEVKNFKRFYQFLTILKNSSTPKIITIKLEFENSYIEPDELYELSTNEMKNIFGNKPFKDMLIQKYPNTVMNNSLKIMKDIVDSLENFGEITYNIKMLKEFYSSNNNTYDSEDSFIGHEIRHFLIFLQRLSATCYDVCSHKSDKSFIDSKSNKFEKYQLNENEFITLSATYIERLINLYKKYKRKELNKLEDVKQLIKSILVKTGHYNESLLHNDEYWLNKLNEIKSIYDIITFYKNCIEERKIKFEKNVKTKKDKYLTLMKWTLNSFNDSLK